MRRIVYRLGRTLLQQAETVSTIRFPVTVALALPTHARTTIHCFASSSSADHEKQFAEQESACWSCSDHYKRGGLVCRACDKLQPMDSSLTYFEMLG